MASARFLLTVNNVPHRKVATELRQLTISEATIRYGKDRQRGVELLASPSAVAVLRGLTLPERVYAVVLEGLREDMMLVTLEMISNAVPCPGTPTFILLKQ